jgi:radical SAM protein with 4Fe4S-binding SPASM domain
MRPEELAMTGKSIAYLQPFGAEVYTDDRVIRCGPEIALKLWVKKHLPSVPVELPEWAGIDLDLRGSFEFHTPARASIVLTDHCNASCVFCYRNAGPATTNHLSNWQLVLDRLYSAGIYSVELTGGEPTTHPDFSRIIEDCFTKFSQIIVLTNGYNLSEELERWGKSIPQNVLFQIDIDSHTENRHDRIKALPGSWQRAIQACKTLHSVGVKFRVVMNVFDANLPDMEFVCGLAKALGSASFLPSPLLPLGRANNASILSRKSYPEFESVVDKISKRYGTFVRVAEERLTLEMYKHPARCSAATGRIAIDSFGNVRPCVLSPISYLVHLGNILHNDLQSIMSSPTAVRMSKWIPPGAEECGNCDDISFCWGCFVRPFHSKIPDCKFVDKIRQETLNSEKQSLN